MPFFCAPEGVGKRKEALRRDAAAQSRAKGREFRPPWPPYLQPLAFSTSLYPPAPSLEIGGGRRREKPKGKRVLDSSRGGGEKCCFLCGFATKGKRGGELLPILGCRQGGGAFVFLCFCPPPHPPHPTFGFFYLLRRAKAKGKRGGG